MKKKILLLALALGLSNCIPTEIVAQDFRKAKKEQKIAEKAEKELSVDTVLVLWVNRVVSSDANGGYSNINARVVTKYGLEYTITGTSNDYLLPSVEPGHEVVVRRFMKLTLLETSGNGGSYDAKEANELIENLTVKRMKENWLSKQKKK